MQWKKILVNPEATIFDVLKIIDEGSVQIALVVGPNGCLIGTVTDGDIRRGILKGFSLDKSVKSVMNTNPIFAQSNQSHVSVLEQMQRKEILQIPVVDENRKVVGVRFLKELVRNNSFENPVVLMAGGEGKRLRPLTNDCPKPLLNVGGKPILESIITSFSELGFTKFVISVHYKAHKIENYFGDGTKLGVNIEYLRESKPLGTAGALSLMKTQPGKPFFVMNADLKTNLDFKKLLSFHEQSKASMTVCVQQREVQIPFGVVEVQSDTINRLVEKPRVQFFANAGIYVLEPHVLSQIPAKQYFDMTNLMELLIRKNDHIAAFAVRENWLDIGNPDDFAKAQNHFAESNIVQAPLKSVTTTPIF